MESIKHKRLFGFAIAATLAAASTSAFAGGVIVTIVDGRKAKADITLPNPAGGEFSAEFEIEFEADNLQNLTVPCIGITADVLTPDEITDIQGRLPRAGQLIDTNFPVRVRVEPPAACGLSFDNQYEVTYETEDIVYTASGPYRLVKAPIGGDFDYVTSSITQGSVRSRGSSGGFSEFVIIKDPNPEYRADCNVQYGKLRTLLDHSSVSPTVRRTLEADLSVSEAAYNANDYQRAIDLLAVFDGHCVEYAGEGLPNRWHSQRDLENVEGDLVGHTANLRFLMGRLNGSP